MPFTNRLGAGKYKIPLALLNRFKFVAAQNTDKNLETFAYLLGRMAADNKALEVKSIFVPRQTATSTSCEPAEEHSLLMEYVNKKGFCVCGWIHTHPSYTCFFSLVDMNTHNALERYF